MRKIPLLSPQLEAEKPGAEKPPVSAKTHGIGPKSYSLSRKTLEKPRKSSVFLCEKRMESGQNERFCAEKPRKTVVFR
jgi:hypothetical protein